MSHELRTPLNAMLGFSELMALDTNLSPDQRENLKRINRSGEHLLAVINDVLHLSRIEAGRLDLQPEEMDLDLFLTSLEEMFRLRAEQKGIYLCVECAADVPRCIRVDQGKLRQVLINLLGNAVKFTTHGGVTLTVQRGPEPSPGIVTNCAPGQCALLLFTVKDTGVGICPDELDTIFDPFVQTASGRQSGEGTGLGLAISHTFMRVMGGDLKVVSAGVPGHGSLFTFDIPVEIIDVRSLAPSLASPPTVSSSSTTCRTAGSCWPGSCDLSVLRCARRATGKKPLLTGRRGAPI
jgi:signal transduction histidine kinase